MGASTGKILISVNSSPSYFQRVAIIFATSTATSVLLFQGREHPGLIYGNNLKLTILIPWKFPSVGQSEVDHSLQFEIICKWVLLSEKS